MNQYLEVDADEVAFNINEPVEKTDDEGERAVMLVAYAVELREQRAADRAVFRAVSVSSPKVRAVPMRHGRVEEGIW